MRKIRTLQRYRCDYCTKTGVRATIERHEKICFQNPNRFCPECENTGKTSEGWDCPYCSQFKPELVRILEVEKDENL